MPKHNEKTIFQRIADYTAGDIYPMHMPGHKRNTALLGTQLPYQWDITEIHGFDNLQNPRGILKRCAEAASTLYGSKQTFLLINGSTGGILAAIHAATRPGDTVLVARNCHRSVYHALELGQHRAVYLLPETDAATGISGSISPAAVEAALAQNPQIRLVVITSPTYEGVISNIRDIANLCHRQGIPLLVDQAHGAHLGLSPHFEGDALQGGADLVVTSLHKTLPALTHCALLHLGGDLIDPARIQRALSIFQTSSPSYLLLASIDQCIRLLAEQKEALFADYASRLQAFDRSIERLKKLTVLCHGNDNLQRHPAFYGFDSGKMVISARGTALTGPELTRLLRQQYGIELEMAYADYAIAMTSIADTAEGFAKLARALMDIDSTLQPADVKPSAFSPSLPRQRMGAWEALLLPGRQVALEQAQGLVSLEYVWAYPPGIPLVVPGEVVEDQVLEQIHALLAAGVELHSTNGGLPQVLTVA